MMRRIIIGLVLLLPTSAFGDLFATPPFVALTSQGRPLVGASVAVTDAGTGVTVPVFSNAAGTIVYPGTVGPTGLVQFFADEGSYRITVSGSGVTHTFYAVIPAGVGALDDSDFSNATPPGHLIKSGVGAYALRRFTISTSNNPSNATDNVTAGYGPLSFWMNRSTNKVFICADCDTDGSTVWTDITSAAAITAIENSPSSGVGVFSAMDGLTAVFRSITGAGGIDVSLDGDDIVIDGSGIMGGGLTNLNGLTNTTQTFTTGFAGSDFNITNNGSTQHIFNIPNAGVGITRGLISDAAQIIGGPKTFNSNVLVSGNFNVTGATVLNEAGAAGSSFRAESDNMPAALYVSSASDSVCVNDFTCVGPETFHVVANAGNAGVRVNSTSGNAVVATATSGSAVVGTSSGGAGVVGITSMNRAGWFVRNSATPDSAVVAIDRLNSSDNQPALKFLHGLNAADIIVANDGTNDEFQVTGLGEVRGFAAVSDSPATPAFSFTNDPDTGMDTNSVGEPIIVDEGVIVGRFGSSNISLLRNTAVSKTSTITSSFETLFNSTFTANPAGNTSASYYGGIISTIMDGAETVNFTGNDSIVGLNVLGSSNTTGTTAEVIGLQVSGEKLGTGAATQLTGLEVTLNNANVAGTVAIGVSLLLPQPVNNGTITDLYGIRQMGSEGNALGGSLHVGSAALASLDMLEVTGDATIAGELQIIGVTGSGKAVCVKANGYLGQCGDQPNGSGVCTCG